ncbi:MAG TPA: glycosyltransferase family 9 protein [Chloroflexota bacterium]|nr:glycosyltransferase family 9 protein [Chloroflexota bacterium]
MAEPNGIRRLAVLRALFLGDLLVAVPAFRSLRAGFPNAEITLIGLPWARSFVRRFDQYFDRFVEFGGYPGLKDVELPAWRSTAFVEEQRRYRYDLVVQMHGSGEQSNPCALALGGRHTAGYYHGRPPQGLEPAAPYPDEQHEVARNLGLARLLGCPPPPAADLKLEFPVSFEDRVEAHRLLSPLQDRSGPLVTIHPGSKDPVRRWPPARFAALADGLVRRLHARIVVAGGADEQAIAAAVVAGMRYPAIDVSGHTSLGGLAALIKCSDLFIGNDSGPSHLAEAVGTPSIRIFRRSGGQWGPLDRTRHLIVSDGTNRGGWIEPDRVLAAAETMLAPGEVA